MTLEKEQNLEQLLKNWREERHLTVEMQNAGLIGNLCEEMAEYYRATNESEKIDALCDMYVFCMNSLDGDLKDIIDDLEIKLFSELFNLKCCKLLLISDIENKLQKLKVEKIIVKTFNLALYILMKNLENEVREMGFNFYECMLETIKEISSRTGHYDKNIHKFVKNKSEEAIKKWYKADYSKCKIE